MSNKTSCIKCKKEFSVKGIHSHYLHEHGTPEEKQKMKKGITPSISASRQKTQDLFENRIYEYSKNPIKCSVCPNDLTYEERRNKFCSSSCAASFNNKKRLPRSDESKKKTSDSLIGKKKIITNPKNYCKITFKEKICTCCKDRFILINSESRTTCSPECQRKNSTYRKIVHEYKNVSGEIILLESSWEVRIAEWLDVNKIEWIRPKHIPWIDSTGKGRKYFPDFYLPEFDLYLDPKNSYQIKISQEKLEVISSKVKLIYGKVEFIKDEILKCAPT